MTLTNKANRTETMTKKIPTMSDKDMFSSATKVVDVDVVELEDVEEEDVVVEEDDVVESCSNTVKYTLSIAFPKLASAQKLPATTPT